MARISYDEALAMSYRLARFEISADDVQGNPDLDDEDRERVFGLAVLALQQHVAEDNRRKMGPPQRRAMALLRALVTPEQRRTLRTQRAFVVEVNGRAYRIHANTGSAQRVVRRGSRYWIEGVFCYHEELTDLAPGAAAGVLVVRDVPPADRAIGVLLMLLADEERFLAEANFRPYRNRGWDSEWMKKRAEIRRQAREAGVPVHDFVTGMQWIGRRLEGVTFRDAEHRARVEAVVALVAEEEVA